MEITAHVMLKNEIFWIRPVITQLCQVFPKVIAADCGSKDGTLEVLVELRAQYTNLQIYNMGEVTPTQNGQVRQFLTERTETEWAAITDGDEFYTLEALRNLFATELPNTVRMTYSTLRIVTWEGDRFVGREQWNKHLLFHVPSTTWRGPFPFENPYPWIDDTNPMTKYYYHHVSGYDLHHLPRSPLDAETPHRLRKDGIRLVKPIECELPELDDFFRVSEWSNPVLDELRRAARVS